MSRGVVRARFKSRARLAEAGVCGLPRAVLGLKTPYDFTQPARSCRKRGRQLAGPKPQRLFTDGTAPRAKTAPWPPRPPVRFRHSLAASLRGVHVLRVQSR